MASKKQKSKKNTLGEARKAKQDEFYTQRRDIENELFHYKDHFKDKVIYMNCDDPATSEFWKFFVNNFEAWEIKKLIATHYDPDETKQSYKIEIERPPVVPSKGGNGGGKGEIKNTTDQINLWLDPEPIPIKGNGDFRSPACIELLKEADIVVTNPPFSKFREYIAQLMKYKKSFVIIGNQNAITYKEFFPYLKNNQIWMGYNSGDMAFKVPDYYQPRPTRFWIDETGQKWRSLGNACWFTNLDIPKRHQKLDLRAVQYKGNEDKYPKYDNYEAIEVSKVIDIPGDYLGVMGVPVTFMSKHSPDQFEIVGLTAGNIRGLAGIESKTGKDGPYIDGKLKYGRIFIKRKDAPQNGN